MSRKIYKIVHGQSVGELSFNVNQQLKQGWGVQGGIAVMAGGIFQAMVKTVLIGEALED